MQAPAFTIAVIAKLGPCAGSFAKARKVLPKRRRITAAQARDAGVSFDDIVWVASAVARTDKDVERRLRLWLADCAARVLHIYEKTETGDAPRLAIIATRQYARGEIDDAARAAAWDAAWDAARAAAWGAARAAARDAAWDAALAAEEAWQFERLILWLSDEPADWPMSVREAKAA